MSSPVKKFLKLAETMADTVLGKYFPDKKLDVSEEHLIEFFDMMYKRQEIWYNRFVKKTSRPWCDDDILNNHKFCNVYRELDKTSQWIIKNIILTEDKLVNKVWKVCLARLFNNIPTFEVLEFPNLDEFDADVFYEMAQEVEKHFPTTHKKAYAVNSWISRGTTQGLAICKYILPSLKQQIGEIFFHGFVGNSNIQQFVRACTDVEGIGKFITHEWYSDFTYFNEYINESFNFDKNTWSNIGPGAVLGLRFCLPSAACNVHSLATLNELSKDFLNPDFKYVKWSKEKQKYVRTTHNLTCATFEFSLCEYQKYQKIKFNTGRIRDKFKPITVRL